MAQRVLIALLLACIAVTPAAAAGKKKEAAKHNEPAAAAEPAGDPVVARVNGAPIYRSDIIALKSSLPPQMQQQPDKELYPHLLDQMVAITLASQAARKTKLMDDPRVKRALMLNEDQILTNAYFGELAQKEITEAKIKARYEQYLKTAPPREEVHARHILLPTEAEAKEVIEELKKGADFAKLASAKTTDPAGKVSGGDLGYFDKSVMVPEIANAAFALKPGEFSQTPIKTQYGWHVIKVEDRRSRPPSYAEVAPRIAHEMSQEISEARLKELAATARIEVFNPDGSPRVAAAPRPPRAEPVAAAPPPPPPAQAAEPPSMLPMENGLPSPPPMSGGPPTMAPATQGMGGK